MSRTKLAIHWMPEHISDADIGAIRAWHPRSVKIINPDVERCRRAYEAAPDALFVLRDHPLSEQHDDMFRDPEATGRRHAQEYAEHVPKWAPMIPRDQIIVTGINEPHVWEPEGIGATVRYYVAFADELMALNLRGGLLNIGVGWPANTGPHTAPDWSGYEPVHEAALRGKGQHFLIAHEYWDHNGPANMWGWWAGRVMRCPWEDVGIIIGECGMDEHVAGPGSGYDSRGWMSNVSAGEYVDQLNWYDAMLCQDDRIHSAQIFTYDFAKPWGTFDVRGLAAQIAHRASLQPELPAWRWPGEPAPPEPIPEPEWLPEHEPSSTPDVLADKARWWTEEYVRALEAGENARAKAILYSLIKHEGGLLYRLEDGLKRLPAEVLRKVTA